MISKILKIAASHVGYVEGKNNDTIFGKWFRLNFNPWCDMAVSMIFFDAGELRSIAPKTKPKGFASCDEHLKYLTKNNQLVPIGQAQAGDLVFFQFDADAAPDHVGIVKTHNKMLKYMNVYEGNTSSGSRGSQSNGEGYFLRRRGYGLIMACARPR